jgi:hypothetical protein
MEMVRNATDPQRFCAQVTLILSSSYLTLPSLALRVRLSPREREGFFEPL